MPLILVGIPVSNVSPSDLAAAPSWAVAISALLAVTRRPRTTARSDAPVTSSWRDGRNENAGTTR